MPCAATQGCALVVEPGEADVLLLDDSAPPRGFALALVSCRVAGLGLGGRLDLVEGAARSLLASRGLHPDLRRAGRAGAKRPDPSATTAGAAPTKKTEPTSDDESSEVSFKCADVTDTRIFPSRATHPLCHAQLLSLQLMDAAPTREVLCRYSMFVRSTWSVSSAWPLHSTPSPPLCERPPTRILGVFRDTSCTHARGAAAP